MTKRCLITGATGAVGPAVVEEFLRAGYFVRALARRRPIDENPTAGEATTGQNPALQFIEGDVEDDAFVARAVEGVDVVVHLAALLHVFDPPPELLADYERVNVTATERLVANCVAMGVQRLVFFSTIAVYGASARALIEGDDPRPDTFYGRSKLAAERIVLAARNRDGQPFGVVLRMAAVYGRRMKGNYLKLAQGLARRSFIPIGAGTNRRSLIFDRDAARAALLAAEHPAAAGDIFNVSDGTSPALSEIIDAICAALGRKPPRVRIPLWFATMAATVADVASRLTRKKFPLSRTLLDKYTEDVAVNSEKIQRVLGFVPEFDQMSGWKEAISAIDSRRLTVK